jgi:tRNA A37 methylthiotransferase MiaB
LEWYRSAARKNLVDSEVMLGLAQQQGHELTRDAADADVLIVNTCAFLTRPSRSRSTTTPWRWRSIISPGRASG